MKDISKMGSVHTGKSHAMTPDNLPQHHHDDDHNDRHHNHRDKWYYDDYPYYSSQFNGFGSRYYPYLYNNKVNDFWNMIQNVIINYPVKPSEIDKETVKRFISTLPIIVPCFTDGCRAFVKDYVNFLNIDDVTYSRQSLGNFFEKFKNDIIYRFPEETSFDYYRIY